ncbi:hypothetical protein GMI69_01675 [Eggerthellaceae bacterium zg-887]|uniref:hypothetical protein n=1 Tax=Xiamenia xianingshaonis TaxID=2682776 RepID=UPI0014085573|nr:hypothetical protein [Xiamenia xianingshaonis]NHM15383.1 hypothetical protein [Xiamenia xianingshaonis]
MAPDNMRTMLAEIQKRRVAYEAELASLPVGHLICSHSKNGDIRYYWAYNDDQDCYCREGVGQNRALRRQLARKAYLEKAVQTLRYDEKLLADVCKRWKPCSPEAILSLVPRAYRDLPDADFFDTKADAGPGVLGGDAEERIRRHEQWGLQPYRRSMKRSEGLTILTSFGLRVRSKAELLIAEKLHEYGIPFRYEQVIVVDGVSLSPDFTFEGADGNEFYLEFCGMMDVPDYVERHLRKRRHYEREGIVPWRNIIYLYASGNEMDMRQIDAVIRTQVVPWL